jgi:hypothetical protein
MTPETETLTQQRQTPPESNGASPDRPEIRESVRMPKKGKIRFILYDPRTRRRIIKERKPPKDGWYIDDKYHIAVALDGRMMWNGGSECWIDVERGIQMDYPGLASWVGVDGRFSYRSHMGRKWEQVQAAKAGDLMKYVKAVMVLVCITLAVLLLAVMFLSGAVNA